MTGGGKKVRGVRERPVVEHSEELSGLCRGNGDRVGGEADAECSVRGAR